MENLTFEQMPNVLSSVLDELKELRAQVIITDFVLLAVGNYAYDFFFAEHD